MADFTASSPALVNFTTVLANTQALSDSVAAVTSAVSVGAGEFPYENYATGVEYIVSIVQNDAIGNLTARHECSFDGTTWFIIAGETYTGVASLAVVSPMRFYLPIGSRQWRYVRMAFLTQSSQATSASTIGVTAAVVGIRQPPFVSTAS